MSLCKVVTANLIQDAKPCPSKMYDYSLLTVIVNTLFEKTKKIITIILMKIITETTQSIELCYVYFSSPFSVFFLENDPGSNDNLCSGRMTMMDMTNADRQTARYGRQCIIINDVLYRFFMAFLCFNSFKKESL